MALSKCKGGESWETLYQGRRGENGKEGRWERPTSRSAEVVQKDPEHRVQMTFELPPIFNKHGSLNR